MAFASFWALLLANFAEYYIQYERINPLGVMLLVIIAVGSILARWLKLPLFTTKGMKERLILMAFMLGAVVGFFFAFFVVMRTCLE